jgi:hypothetical protein
LAKKKREQQQGPPIQFRPGVQLQQLVAAFAGQHGLATNDASKMLVALAAAELDSRFYSLVNQMAQAMGGLNAFVRSCDYIRISLEAGRRATGHPLELDPERASFIVRTVCDYVASKGLPVEGVRLAFLPVGEDLAASQHGQEPVHEDVGQQETQPARRILHKQVADQARRTLAVADQPETPEGTQSAQGKTRPDPAR